MPGPDPHENNSQDGSSVNISGGENTIRGDVIGGDKIIQGDVNTATIGENARVGQVAVGTGITQIYNEAELSYDVHGLANPYLGLSAFKYEDRAKYAGREKLIAETVAKITAPGSPVALLFITGASGSGKSSFAQAGLLPALEKFYDRFTVKHAVMRPAGDPFAAWNDALWRQLRVGETLEVSQDLKGLEATPPNQINLLVLDQFEEFFTQAPQAAREQFFAFLADVPKFAQTRTHIIATMRADYLPELFSHSALYQIQQQGVPLRAMNADELAQAIQQPLRASPYAQEKRFVPALVEKLAQDAAQDAAYLPLLQVTLEEIWRKGFLKLEAYTNLTDAIKQRADQVLEYRDFDDATPDEKRDPAEQVALLNLLLDLVDVSSDDDIHRDVRKQRAKTDLTRNEITRTRLVDELARARLLSVQQEGKDTNRIEVDLIHETLLTNWTRLQSAIAERRSELRHRARFEQNLDEWLAQNRSDEYVLHGIRLAEARELEAHGDVALQSDQAKAYLRASIAKAEAAQQAELERERQRAEALEQAKHEAEKSAAAEKQRGRILRFAIAGVSVLALLAMLASCFAFQQKNAADASSAAAQTEAAKRGEAEADALAKAAAAQTAEAKAKQESIISQSKSLAAQSLAKRGEDLSLAYLLGIAGFKTSNTAEARSNLFNLRYEDGHPKSFLWGHKGPVTSVAFSPDGKTLASGSLDNTILLWDVASQQRVGELKGHTNYVVSVAFSPDGKTLASGSADNTIILWDVASQQRVGKLKGHTDDVVSVAFSPDGKTLASGSADQTILLWDMSAAKDAAGSQPRVGELKGHTGDVRSVAFSPDGKTLASGSCAARDSNGNCPAGQILLWDVASQTRVGELKGHTFPVNSVAFSPDGKTLASGSGDNTILLWDVARQQRVGELKGHQGVVYSVAFSPDGKTLASGNFDQTILLWDVASQQRVGELKGHTFAVTSVAFSPDGKTLASGSYDQTILLWDVASQQRVGKLKGHTNYVSSVAFSPDGNTLASGSDDQTILLWDVDVQSWLKIVCRVVNRNFTRAEYAQYISRESGKYDSEYAKDPTCPGLPVEPLPTPTP